MNKHRKSPGPRRPTMTDVAKAAGVSQSTVSMVLNQVLGARLSVATRERVLTQALALGYGLPRRPPVGALTHRSAASPANGATGVTPRNVIGYVVDEISTSPHPVVSVDGARDAAWDHGLVLHVAVTRNNPQQEAASLAALLAHPALLGVIYSTVFTRQVHLPPQLLQVPTVLLNCHPAGHQQGTLTASAYAAPAVLPAEVHGGHIATEHLIAQGHRRIALINGEPWMEAAQDRYKGYRRALASADLPLDPALVLHGDWMSGSGFEGTMKLMAMPHPPSAIFCANDLMALGALEALKQLQLRVPQDVSVMGFDDQEISRHTHPPLSTVVLPNYEMGQAAVERLLALAATWPPTGTSPATRPWVLKVDGPLVLRDTVGAYGGG